MTKEYPSKDKLKVSFYFWDALEHYVYFQDHYFNEYPDDQKPFSKNSIRFDLFERIINHISENDYSTESIYEACLFYAKPKLKAIDLECLYRCPVCKNKVLATVSVTTNKDEITMYKNGTLDYEAVSEYQNTEEKIGVDVNFEQDPFLQCECQNDIQDEDEKNRLLYENIGTYLRLEDNLVSYLKDKIQERGE